MLVSEITQGESVRDEQGSCLIPRPQPRTVFCWSHLSGYMSACWTRLAQTGFPFQVLCFESGRADNIAFRQELANGFSCRHLTAAERLNSTLISELVEEFDPEVIVIPGWMHGPYRELLGNRRFAGRKFIMTMDTPWRGTAKQWVGCSVLKRYVSRFDQVIATGERAYQYAMRLGVPLYRIRTGLYGVDWENLGDCQPNRERIAPRSFLFAGRYVEEKGIDCLVQAYAGYRQSVDDPWPLTCCGMGPLGIKLAGQPGITDRGFVQPTEMPSILSQHAVFVLPSRFDPWPLALVEACASGMPVLATRACGSAVELLRDQFNGRVVPEGSVAALQEAMVWFHQQQAQLIRMGKLARQFAEPYSTDEWVHRWTSLLSSE